MARKVGDMSSPRRILLFSLASFGLHAGASGPQDEYHLLSGRLAPDTKVVIIAERHEIPAIQKRNISILWTLKTIDSQFNCYLSEYSVGAVDEIRRYKSGERYAATIRAYQNRMQHKMNLLPENIASAALRLNYDIMPVDIDWESEDGVRIQNTHREDNPDEPADLWEPYYRSYIDERNTIMADNIITNMNSGACSRAVFVVGSDHVGYNLCGFSLTPIQEHLARQGVKAQVF